MSTEQPAPDRRQPSQEPPRRTDEYDLLLRRYGEAMLRIGELEARLREQGESGLAEEAPAEPNPKAAAEPAAAPTEGPRQDLKEQKDRQMSQLRFQVTSLSTQLAEAQQRVQELQKSTRQRRRSSRRHQRSRWKFWRRWGRHY